MFIYHFLDLSNPNLLDPLLQVNLDVRQTGSICMIWTYLILAFIIIAGCAGGDHQTGLGIIEHPQRGVASWYGPGFHGNLTANGEIYDMWALTAAHRTLPFGSRVLVQSMDTGKSVTVRINDRGPFIRGRIIDLSYGAARELAMIGKGTEDVVLTILDSVSDYSENSSNEKTVNYWVQAASFAVLAQAVSLQEQLAHKYPHVKLMSVDLPSGQWHRVQVGTFHSQKKAKRVATELANYYHLDPMLIQDK